MMKYDLKWSGALLGVLALLSGLGVFGILFFGIIGPIVIIKVISAILLFVFVLSFISVRSFVYVVSELNFDAEALSSVGPFGRKLRLNRADILGVSGMRNGLLSALYVHLKNGTTKMLLGNFDAPCLQRVVSDFREEESKASQATKALNSR